MVELELQSEKSKPTSCQIRSRCWRVSHTWPPVRQPLIPRLILVDSTRRGKVSVNWGMELTEAYARCSVKDDTHMVGSIFWTRDV